MASYVISDIHGEYDKFIRLLDLIDLKDEDTLYILGDVLDRGPHPIRTLHKIMEMPNVIPLAGNHEIMAIKCLDWMREEVTVDSVAELDDEKIGKFFNWWDNGCKPTLDEYAALSREEQDDIIDFIEDFLLYEEVEAGGKSWLLVHAGLGSFSPDKAMEDYTVNELVWERPDYEKDYFPDKYVITGHTPTQLIKGNPRPGYIYRRGHHIAIDCGAFIKGGRLAALCLDTGEEFYSN